MSGIRIHPDASAETLATARIFVGFIWLTRLLRDPLHNLGHLPAEIWHAQGILGLLPDSLVLTLMEPLSLSVLRIVAITFTVLVILGTRPHRLTLAGLVTVLILYLGISRGFGGHVNHRELVLLYVTGLLLLLPSYDALAMHQARRMRDPAIYRAAMITICLLIGVSYMFVGLARVTMGFPSVFDPDVMRGWLVGRSLRPNPLGMELTSVFLDMPISNYLIAAMMPAATLMEVLAPSALWLRQRYRALLLVGLAAMHMMVALLMNIVFFENVLLLVLFLDYTPWLERLTGRRPELTGSGPLPAGTPPAG